MSINNDVSIKTENINLNTEIGVVISRQDYIELNIDNETSVKVEDINLDTEIGLIISKQDYIKIEEVEE